MEPIAHKVEEKQEIGSSDLEKINQTYQLIEKEYVHKVSKGKLLAGALDGMMQSLDDPYSVYMDARTVSQFKQSLDSSFEGIGAEISMKDGVLLIVSPMKGSPAEKAGLRPNDRILSINKISVKGMDIYEATSKIKGKKGSSVKLEIDRKGVPKPLTLSVKRDDIPLETVHSKMIKHGEKELGYIQLTTFSENTAKDFKKQLDELEKEKMDGLILDVRGNPGGLLSSAEGVLKEMVTKKNPLFQIEKRTGDTTSYYSELNKRKDYPIAVLVDEGSASASEIVAGALQEAEGYPLIGTKTFGKGTVQQTLPLGDGSELKLTMFKWKTPNGTWIHGKGIEPTIAVKQPSYFHLTSFELEKDLKKDMNSEEVKTIQEMLQADGLDPGRSDGYFNKKTEQVVKQYQLKHKFPVTGKVDRVTLHSLEQSIKEKMELPQNDLQLQKAIGYFE